VIATGDAVLVLNAGSSSIKFEVFEVPDAPPPLPRFSGQLEGIGAAPRFTAKDAQGARLADRRWNDGGAPGNHRAALGVIIDWLDGVLAGQRVAAVGHRVVHGGADLAAPVLVDIAVMERLRELSPLAPLHQPHNLSGIAAAAERFPGVPQVACFDTAFHRAHAWEADTFALPAEFYDRGIRRYGFHGLSYEYIARSLAESDPALAAGRVVVAHLGNGASLCAIHDGRSVDSTMGFTALDGVPMGTRSGQIDPGVLLHLMMAEGMSATAVQALLYGNAGLKGMSGISQDVRDLEASDDPRAAQALSHFCWRVRREIGALAAALGGIDALVFTAGIGENAAAIRARICDGLGFLGIAVDPARNAAHAPEISPADAATRVLVRPTDEEGMIARHVLGLLQYRETA
jgi:acetate kinase